MPDFSSFPKALAQQTRTARLAGVPALLAHPDWRTPAPTMLWLHGRTVSKELDPGRYLRWIRAGIAAVAIDLPGHGERYAADFHHPRRTLHLLSTVIQEIDRVIEALAAPEFGGVFDLDRLGIGGMSAGGMATLRRLCDPHPFTCAAVESTTGWLKALYYPELTHLDESARHKWAVQHPIDEVARLDPMEHLSAFRPIPLLALHTEADSVVPIIGMREFIESLRVQYGLAGANPEMIEFQTWPATGAPDEHAGFGKFGNDAKNAQVEFLTRRLKPAPKTH